MICLVLPRSILTVPSLLISSVNGLTMNWLSGLGPVEFKTAKLTINMVDGIFGCRYIVILLTIQYSDSLRTLISHSAIACEGDNQLEKLLPVD